MQIETCENKMPKPEPEYTQERAADEIMAVKLQPLCGVIRLPHGKRITADSLSVTM